MDFTRRFESRGRFGGSLEQSGISTVCYRTLSVSSPISMEAAVEVFDRADQHDEYVEWIERHWEDGLVLHSNRPPDGELKLHSARCGTIGGGGAVPTFGDTWTNNPKRCSEDRTELIEWALAHGAARRDLVCQRCEHLQ